MTETARATRIGVVGLGKMGLSHHALLNAHPDVELAGVCDSSSYVLGVLAKHTGVGDLRRLRARCWREAELDAVMIATPVAAPRGDGRSGAASGACTCSARSR